VLTDLEKSGDVPWAESFRPHILASSSISLCATSALLPSISDWYLERTKMTLVLPA